MGKRARILVSILAAAYIIFLANYAQNIAGLLHRIKTVLSSSSESSAHFMTFAPYQIGETKVPICLADEFRYRNVQCPVWDNDEDGTLIDKRVLDWRVRYIWKRQHPSDCRAAKFFTLSVTDRGGYGALLRGFIGPPLLGAIYSDRVLVFENDTFPYAGCKNNSGWNCYFEPMTNCSYARDVTPTLENAQAGTGKFDWQNSSHRVYRYDSKRWSANRMHQIKPFVDIFQPTEDELLAGVYLYLLRLNQETRARVEAILKRALPCDLDPARTISLPIRASDKCIGDHQIRSTFKGESSCLSFQTYMDMAETIRKMDPQVDTIILTSEDRRFVDARHSYGRVASWRFITNPYDVMQASGDSSTMTLNNTMDSVFMSFFSSLQMQMRGQYFILNCNSNFHQLLRALVMEGGCSYTTHPVVICMDAQVGKYRVCNGKDQKGYDKCMEGKNLETLLYHSDG